MEWLTFDRLITIGGIFVNLVGFVFVIRQIRQQALATRGETYASLCGLSYEILQMMADHPELYPYFYENKELAADAPDRVRVLCCCEMVANYCDNTALQRENIPDHVWQRWRVFIKQQVAMSVVLKGFFLEYRMWYSPEIGEILDEL